MAYCKDCLYCVWDDRVTDYRRDAGRYVFCSRKGAFFSRNYRVHEGTRIAPEDLACEQFEPKESEKQPSFAAVSVAAGNSTRMGGTVSKLLLPLAEEPVLAHTLRAFDACERLDRVVVVTREEDREAFIPLMVRFCHKPYCLVCGGQTRQESVANGIEAAGEADYYVIHDGARPLITPQLIDAVCVDAMQWGASTLAVPVKDTCKLADENGVVTATPDRSALWAVQTPQVFESTLYRSALEKSRAAGLDFTDDCQLVEYVGGKVHLCRGSYENMKMTTPEDLIQAQALLLGRQNKIEKGADEK